MNCDRKDLVLYAVTDRSWLGDKTLYSQVESALKGGATFVQLREKELDDADFLEEAKEIQKLCREYKVPFVINDNVEIAAEIGADGVHVGQSDMEGGETSAGSSVRIRSSACPLRRWSRRSVLRSMEQTIWEWELCFLPGQRLTLWR